MFVCLCKGLDEKGLEKMQNEGIDTLPKVINACGAGGDCGSCAFKINRLLKEKAATVDSSNNTDASQSEKLAN